jgi:hypothetical protein
MQTALTYNVQSSTSLARSCSIGATPACLFIYFRRRVYDPARRTLPVPIPSTPQPTQPTEKQASKPTLCVYPSEIIPSEITPLKLRQRGSLYIDGMQITPVAISDIRYRMCIGFAVVNACWVPSICFMFSETEGLGLEDLDGLFAKDGSAREE